MVERSGLLGGSAQRVGKIGGKTVCLTTGLLILAVVPRGSNSDIHFEWHRKLHRMLHV